MSAKHCKRCNQDKPLEEFYVTKTGKYAGRIISDCKSCCSKRAYAHHLAHPEMARARSSEYYHRKVKNDPLLARKMKTRKWEIKLGFAAGWYEQTLVNQNGLCAICGNAESTKGTHKNYKADCKRLAIDHCHAKMIPRGLLCMSCNTKLSVLEDAEFVAKAQAYLSKYP